MWWQFIAIKIGKLAHKNVNLWMEGILPVAPRITLWGRYILYEYGRTVLSREKKRNFALKCWNKSWDKLVMVLGISWGWEARTGISLPTAPTVTTLCGPHCGTVPTVTVSLQHHLLPSISINKLYNAKNAIFSNNLWYFINSQCSKDFNAPEQKNNW